MGKSIKRSVWIRVAAALISVLLFSGMIRSEERRVGKEC